MDAIRKIDKQIELEHTASKIYRELEKSSVAAELKSLWSTLALHEEYHAAALEHLKATLSDDELEEEASTLDENNLDKRLEGHKRAIKEIPKGVSMKRSFEIAIFLEFSELNSLYFNSLTRNDEDPSPYIHSIGEGTRSHLLALYKGIRKFLGEKEQAPYMKKFSEYGLIKE